MKYLYLFAVLLMACTQGVKNEDSNESNEVPITAEVIVNDKHHSESIKKVFEAHGSYASWASKGSLSFKLGDETHLNNLKNRKVLITSPSRTIGFDGAEVWVTPDSIDASRARFYHNLFFYFYAMPFVVGDPGVFYEDMEPKELNGKVYGGVKVSYGEGVGDSPNDYYIIWYDPETFKMEWLMYTVTYGKNEASDSFSLIRYNDWAEKSGLILPTSLQWHTYKDGEVGEMRSERLFEDIILSENEPEENLFEMPEGAQISPAPEI
ncbi:MAG: DUF6503 family protein [Bacteroidota bacterium]